MRGFVMGAVLGAGLLAMAGAAMAQEGGGPPPRGGQGGPPGGFTPPPPVAAPLWALDVPFAAKDPIIFADLDLGGPAGFTGVIKGGQLCYIISTPGMADASGADILQTSGGKSVVPLKAPKDGSAGGCVAVSAALATSLATNPGDYTVNVKSKDLPISSSHGQLQARGLGQKWADKNI